MTHFWKAPLTINGTRFDFFTATDDGAVSADLKSPPETSFLRKDVCLARLRGQEPVEVYCERRPLEAHALLAEAALQHHIATVHQVQELCSAVEIDSFEENGCDLVNVVDSSGLSLRIWRRLRL